MGNYESIGKYKVKMKNEDSLDSYINSKSKKNYRIEKAYYGYEKGYLLIFPIYKSDYDHNINSMNEVFEIISSKQEKNKIFVKAKDIFYDVAKESVIVYFSFPERSNFISIKDYIDGIDLYYLKCSHIRNIALKLNEIIKFIKENKLPYPFFSPEELFFDKKTLTEVKYIYIYPYFQCFLPYGYNFYSKMSSIIPKKVKNFFPESNYLNWNIGLFLYRILFRETPNYQIKTKDGINYYSIDIKDYRISDYDESLFDLLHFLLDIKINENINNNDNLIENENELFNNYLSHPFFENKQKKKAEIINSISTKKYTLKEIKKKTISSIINTVDDFKRLTIYEISKKLPNREYAIFFFNNSDLFVIYFDTNFEVYNMDYNLLYKKPEDSNYEVIHRFKKGFLYKKKEGEYGSFIFNKKDFFKTTIKKFKLFGQKLEDYFIRDHNKLLINENYKTLVYDFNGLILGKNKEIQLETIIQFKLFEKTEMIAENVKSNELISLNDEFIYFYGSEIYDLKFKLYCGNKNGIIKKIDDEMFLIGFLNHFYLLKKHKFLFTFYSKSGVCDLKYGILLNKNLLLCFLNKESSDTLNFEFPKYGKEILVDLNTKKEYNYKLILYQIDDNYAKKQKLNIEYKDFIQYYYLKDNIIRMINKKKKYKYYRLEEE